MGTVGRPLSGVDVRIADDGEILTRGPHVMLGYYGRPDATEAAIRDGWLHTGDLGQIDSEGYLRITGRKKDLIVLATGKKVVPTSIETRLTQDPYIRQAMVVGEGRKYLAALVVPDFDVMGADLNGLETTGLTVDELIVYPDVRAIVAERIKQRLAELSEAEQVRQFALVPYGFTIDNGELTPTLKLRRGQIAKNRADLIDALYNGIATTRSAGTGLR
jgi:long-chain acyl-CoA synthetase